MNSLSLRDLAIILVVLAAVLFVGGPLANSHFFDIAPAAAEPRYLAPRLP